MYLRLSVFIYLSLLSVLEAGGTSGKGIDAISNTLTKINF